MNKFVWTKKTPTEAGFYWKRNFRRDEKETVIEIRNYAGKLSVDNCALSSYVEGEEYEWAGPIPEPVEQTQNINFCWNVKNGKIEETSK